MSVNVSFVGFNLEKEAAQETEEAEGTERLFSHVDTSGEPKSLTLLCSQSLGRCNHTCFMSMAASFDCKSTLRANFVSPYV